ncbi:hypothetical protein VIMS_01317 [Mycobacterium marinum]|nr:hypothetical protein VIMS_01317 [Mycobacterium marinum]
MCGEAALLSARSNSDLECVGGKVILGGPATASEPVVRAATMAVNRCVDLECVGGKVILGGPATASEPVVRAATMAVNRCVAVCTALAFRDVVTANSTTAIPVSSSTEQQATVAM